jgi:hypothetical protein
LGDFIVKHTAYLLFVNSYHRQTVFWVILLSKHTPYLLFVSSYHRQCFGWLYCQTHTHTVYLLFVSFYHGPTAETFPVLRSLLYFVFLPRHVNVIRSSPLSHFKLRYYVRKTYFFKKYLSYYRQSTSTVLYCRCLCQHSMSCYTASKCSFIVYSNNLNYIDTSVNHIQMYNHLLHVVSSQISYVHSRADFFRKYSFIVYSDKVKLHWYFNYSYI